MIIPFMPADGFQVKDTYKGFIRVFGLAASVCVQTVA